MDAQSQLYNLISQDQFYPCDINKQGGCQFVNQNGSCQNGQLGNDLAMAAAILSFISVLPMIVILFLKHRNDRPRYGVILLFISDLIFSSISAPFLIAYAAGGDYRNIECIDPDKQQCVCGIGKHKNLCGLRAFFSMVAFFSLFLNAMVIMYTIYLHLYLKQVHTESFKLWKIASVTFGVPLVFATTTVATGSFSPELPNYATICFTSSQNIIGKIARFAVFIVPYFVACIFQIFVLVRIFTKQKQQNEEVIPLDDNNHAEHGVEQTEMQKETHYFLLIYPITLLLFWIVNIVQRMSEAIDRGITNESFNYAGFILANCDGFVNSIVYGYFMWKDHKYHNKVKSEEKQEQNSSLSEYQKSQQRLSFEKFKD